MKKHINVQISEDIHQEVKEVIPRGLVGYLYQSILRLILDAIRQDGQVVLGAILAGEYRLSIIHRGTNAHQNLVNTSND